MATPIRLIGSCPVAKGAASGPEYLKRVAMVSRWAEADGWESLLIYTDHRQLDPWLVAQVVLQETRALTALVALQPIYMHPFSAAKNILSLSLLYGRPLQINFVAGGFPRDLQSLCDELTHDQRYERAVEYGTLVSSLLESRGLVSFTGNHYNVRNLQLLSSLPPALLPRYTISGSSPAGLSAASSLGACAIQYLRPPHECQPEEFPAGIEYGTRLGIIVRDRAEEARRVAQQRFPHNPAGAAIHRYAVSVSDSVWVKQLATAKDDGLHCYWLAPYQNAQASSPYLVGSQTEVAALLAQYLALGITTFLLEEPDDEADSRRITEVFRMARSAASIAA